MSKTLYLFPDTNLFVQCKALDQLDWALFGADRIDLIVTRPIIAEIDSHKGRGNSRLAKRSRSASSIIGDALIAESGFLSVGGSAVDVRLFVKATLKEDAALDDQLTYTERDHQLVGIASKFAKEKPEADVRVLTHDNGVLAAASGVGVRFERISDDWLLGPETDERDKQLAGLQQELKKYQASEPVVEISLGKPAGSNGPIEADVPFYPPLTEGEIARLLHRLKAEFPVETDFGPSEAGEFNPVGLQAFVMARKVFKPSTDEDINQYRTEAYPNWLAECEAYLRAFNETLNARRQWPMVRIDLKNTGSRPAQDVLVSFSCEGKFSIAVPTDDEDMDEDDTGEGNMIRLPPPPSAPKGTWEEQPHALSELRRALGQVPNVSQFPPLGGRYKLPDIPIRDPNGFYYDGGRPKEAVVAISLSCKQWRHQMAAEEFSFELRWAESSVPIQAALCIGVHAANLTDRFTHRFAVRLNTREESAYEEADAMIDLLKTKPLFK